MRMEFMDCSATGIQIAKVSMSLGNKNEDLSTGKNSDSPSTTSLTVVDISNTRARSGYQPKCGPTSKCDTPEFWAQGTHVQGDCTHAIWIRLEGKYSPLLSTIPYKTRVRWPTAKKPFAIRLPSFCNPMIHN